MESKTEAYWDTSPTVVGCHHMGLYLVAGRFLVTVPTAIFRYSRAGYFSMAEICIRGFSVLHLVFTK